MSANTNPIFSAAPRSPIGTVLTAANTATDGTGTVATLITAGANGSFVSHIRIRPVGSNVISVLRLFINNGSTNTTATNNALIDEIALPATTISQVAQQADYRIPCNFGLEPGFKLLATLGTAVAAGWAATAFGGDY